jgi:hypothetical protein
MAVSVEFSDTTDNQEFGGVPHPCHSGTETGTEMGRVGITLIPPMR